jgi:acetyl-CoA decarbonylase/synthase, CODH/ACS complex subunit gamma
MPLSGLDIFKLLPKTNCKDCGFPTCLAFAMQLAAGKAELEKCPHVSEEAAEALAEASQPPILKVEIGTGEQAFRVGEETVLFRHDRTFVNPNAFAVLVNDNGKSEELDETIKKIESLKYDRVGQILEMNAVCLINTSKSKDTFLSCLEKISVSTNRPLILISDDADTLKTAAEKYKDKKPLIHAINNANIGILAPVIKETGCPVVVRGSNFDEISALTSQLRGQGIKNIVIDIGNRKFKEDFFNSITLRRTAINKKDRLFGYPTIVFPCEMTEDPLKETLLASVFVAKYASIIVLSNSDPQNIFPLFVYRQNIYTDPRKPMTVDQDIYEINNPKPDSPILITTNFSLTYFIISSEIESSRVPTRLLVMDVEGQSVLTAWAAGKFVPELIANYIKKSGIAEKTEKKEIIIPGYVAQLQGELEDELGDGWKIIVGPREAGEVPKFLKNYVSS